MNKFFMKYTLLMACIVGLLGTSFGQTTLTQTTASAAVASTDQFVNVTSATGFTAGNLLSIDKEVMRINSVSGTVVSVLRGVEGTGSRKHASGATVNTGALLAFKADDQSGACTRTDYATLPVVAYKTGNLWDCDSTLGVWTMVSDANVRAFTDGVLFIPATTGNCAVTAATTALAAANPAMVRAAASNPVLSATTNTTAGTVTFTCDLGAYLSRTATGKGVYITDVSAHYGYQTTALSAIGAATFNRVTYGAAGAAAAGVVSSALGGSVTTTVGTNHTTPGAATTSGACLNEKSAFGTPINSTDLANLTYEQVFTTAGTTATTIQLCGFTVHYTWYPL